MVELCTADIDVSIALKQIQILNDRSEGGDRARVIRQPSKEMSTSDSRVAETL